jgi:hypothetical protein
LGLQSLTELPLADIENIVEKDMELNFSKFELG